MANGRRLVKHSCWHGCCGSPEVRCLSTSNLDLVSAMHNILDTPETFSSSLSRGRGPGSSAFPKRPPVVQSCPCSAEGVTLLRSELEEEEEDEDDDDDDDAAVAVVVVEVEVIVTETTTR